MFELNKINIYIYMYILYIFINVFIVFFLKLYFLYYWITADNIMDGGWKYR